MPLEIVGVATAIQHISRYDQLCGGEDIGRWGLKGDGAVGYLKQKSEFCLIFGRSNVRENHEHSGSVGRRELFINGRL